jgi:Kef-type K+ transport system membrane component KefB
LEINLAILARQVRLVTLTSLLGIVVPFTLGFLLGLNLPDDYLIDTAQRLLFSFFLATALSISAIPIIAKILMDLSLLRTNVGQAILGAAIINDLVGWVFFAVILSMLTNREPGQGSVTTTALLTITFAAACLTFGRKLVTKLFDFFKDLKLPPEGILGVAVLVAFLCAAFTQWIGIHAIFGAFLAGVMIGETGEASNGARELLRHMVFYIFAPIFFASMGLRANFVDHFDLPLVLAVLAIAVAAKFTGGYLGAYLGAKRGHQACAIGFGLMPQGAMGVILAFLALELSLINETVFVALVSTALVTSILSGPLIKWSMAHRRVATSAIPN